MSPSSSQLRGDSAEASQTGVGILMSLRKLANHPVLMRYHYDEDKVRVEVSEESLVCGDGEWPRLAVDGLSRQVSIVVLLAWCRL